MKLNLPKNQEFTRHMITADNRYFGNAGMKFNYDSTGGEYVKIRIKLSDYFLYVFNDDGTMTGKLSDGTYKNFDFTYEDFGTDSSGKPCYATSGAYFVSGGAVTSFVPDKNGSRIRALWLINIADLKTTQSVKQRLVAN